MKRLVILFVIIGITGLSVASSDNYNNEKRNEIRQLLRSKQFDEVEKYLDLLLSEEEPRKIYTRFRSVIVILEQECEIEKALEFTNKYIEKYSDYSGDNYFYFQQGYLLFDLNRYDLAIQSSEKFLANFHGFRRTVFEGLTRWRLGLLYYRTQEYEKAEYNLKWSMENRKRTQPNGDVIGSLDLIDVYLAWGKNEEAKKIIDAGLQLFSKENKDIKMHYNRYYVKMAQYYFVQKDWRNYQKFNKLQVPFYLKFTWGGLISKLDKMDHVYKYRENEDFVNAYINYLLWKREAVINLEIEEDGLKKEQLLALQTMKGIAHYWLGEKEKAKELLIKANTKSNFLVDEASYYAALIEFEQGNYREAEEQLKNYRSLSKSDVTEGATLVRRIQTKFGKLKYFGEK